MECCDTARELIEPFLPRDLWRDTDLIPTTLPPLLVVSMQLHHPFLQLAGLVGGEAEVADVVGAVVVVVVVAQLGLHGVGAQKGVGDERARQSP